MDLQMLSSVTKGLGSFGEAAQYYGASKAYKNQASLLDVEAKSVIQSGNFQADRMREQGNRFLSSQRAKYAKAGVRLEGSPIEALMTSERNLSLDILMTKLNAVNQANRIGFEALNARIAAGQAKTRMIQSIGSGILKMASSYATK